MRDLPTGPALLALAREVLLSELMPLLPPEARLDARLVANGMAIAEREAMAGDEPEEAILRELQSLYAEAALTRPAFTLAPPRERGKEWEACQSGRELLCRFAQDLRVGAFETSQPLCRHAREILWQLTIAKLRCANPRFLHANGFR
jgi:hypothetical protein